MPSYSNFLRSTLLALYAAGNMIAADHSAVRGIANHLKRDGTIVDRIEDNKKIKARHAQFRTYLLDTGVGFYDTAISIYFYSSDGKDKLAIRYSDSDIDKKNRLEAIADVPISDSTIDVKVGSVNVIATSGKYVRQIDLNDEKMRKTVQTSFDRAVNESLKMLDVFKSIEKQ